MGTRRLLVRIATQFDGKGVDETKKSTKELSSIFDNLGSIATGALVAAGAALVKFGNDSIKSFQGFDKGMREVFTLMPGITADAMDQMEQQALDAAASMGKLPEEVVPALYQALSAGVPPDNVFNFLETANAAALGGVTDLETAVDGITSVVNAYGDEVINAATASDVMFTAVKLGKTNFEQLSNSLFNVIPTAASLGVKFEDVAANLAALTAQGTPTSVATTQLRQAFIEASTSGTALDQALKSLTGQSFAQLIASGKTSSEIFSELRDSMPEQEFRDLFGSVEASNAVLGITSDTAAGIIDTFGGLEGTIGATTEAADLMVESMAQLESRAAAVTEAYKIQLGEGISPLRAAFLELKIATMENAIENNKMESSAITAREALKAQGLSASEAERALTALSVEGRVYSGTQEEAEALTRRAAIAQQLLADGFQGTAKELGEQAKLIDETEGGMRAYNLAAGEFYAAQAEAAAATASVTEGLTEQTTVLRLNDELMRTVNRTLLEYGGSLGPTSRELEEMAYASGELGDYQEAMLTPIRENKEALDEQAEATRRLAEQSGNLFVTLSESEGPLGLYHQSLEDIANGASSLTVNQDSLNNAMITAASNAGASASQIAILKIATGELSAEQAEAVIKQVALEQTLQRLGEMYANGSLSMGDYISAAQQAVRDINNMTIEFDTQTGAVNTDNEAIGTLIGTMGQIPSEIRTHISVTSDPLPNMPGGNAAPGGATGSGGTPQARAVGGPVNAGQPYIIGERGPELFVPNASGTVVPNNALGGQITMNAPISIHAQSGNPEEIATAVQAALLRSFRQVGVK